VSPIPSRWVAEARLRAGLPGEWYRQDGLWWATAQASTPWTQRVGGAGLSDAWALWTWLTSQGAERAGVAGMISLLRDIGGDPGVLGSVGRQRWCTDPSLGGHLVALGCGGGAGVVVPGPSLEDSARDLGYRMVWWWPTWVVSGPAGSPAPIAEAVRRAAGRAGAGQGERELIEEVEAGTLFPALVDLERERAARWLRADPSLGRVLLLGPLPVARGRWGTSLRHASGYLDADGGLSMAGWWRLAFLARQGVGPTECYRQRRLRDKKVRRHLRLVQKICLRLMRDEGCIPLGVEFSAVEWVIKRETGVRADALLVGASGQLIWVEVMRRELRRSSGGQALKYRLLESTHLPYVADRLRRPVEYVLQVPSGTTTKEIRPLGGNGW